MLYNGLDVSDMNLKSYRRDISLVAQEPNLFDASLRDNILLGVDTGAASEEELHQACRDAGIHDFIASLPEGYDTEVGTRGVALSGGQKQRIAIARALIRNPRLLLLDEATSNLDSETERQVQAVFERTKKERTMVVVAHRLATVQNADIIYVLGDGRVLEKGNHAALLKKKGVYYQMVSPAPFLPSFASRSNRRLFLSSANLKPWIGSVMGFQVLLAGPATNLTLLLHVHIFSLLYDEYITTNCLDCLCLHPRRTRGSMAAWTRRNPLAAWTTFDQ